MSGSTGKPVAYGGVVVDAEGRILLREVAGHFGGYVYTFAKGRPDPGELPAQTAVREVREETGVEAAIVGELPGVFEGDTSDTKFFVMRIVHDHGDFGRETAAVVWVQPEQVGSLLSKTRSVRGRQRDLAVLAAYVAQRSKTSG